MAYRDELEALRARIADLERDNQALLEERDALRSGRGDTEDQRWLGGRLLDEHELSIERACSAAEIEALLDLCRDRFGEGVTRRRGRRLRWSTGRRSARRIELTVAVTEGRTRLRLVERSASLAGGLFGGVVGGAGGSGFVLAIVLGALFSPAAIVLGPLWLASVFLLVRAMVGTVLRERSRELAALTRSFEEQLGDTTAAPTARVRVEAPSATPAHDEDAEEQAERPLERARRAR